jgi:signal transduction histidine kinase
VLANLVSNAVRHAEPDTAVGVRLSTDGPAAIVEVENAGVSLSQEDAVRVFDRFYRAESSRTTGSEGAGLGLAIVRSIVELHGGKASALSDPPRTIFRVTLRAAAPASFS